MIHGFIHAIKEDSGILMHWAKGEEPDVGENEDPQQRIQLAAARMLACIGMVFAAVWSFSILTFIVTVPLKIALKLAVAVSFYALAHDIFVMSQNSAQPDFRQSISARLWNLFRGQEIQEEDQARQFTQGTFLQPAWMWLYVNRNVALPAS